jgi:hypothetical protein
MHPVRAAWRDSEETGGERPPDRRRGLFVRKAMVTLAATTVLAAVPGSALAGVSGPAFFVNGTVYRTVGTPTDISGTGAPAGSFDTIYEFFGAQMNVATAAPGDVGYNGGRWMVHGLDWISSYEDAVAEHGGANGVIDTNDEIAAVLADTGDGGATTSVVKSFVCPVIKLPR